MTKIGRYVRQHHLALLALFVALGGTAYAAVANNSIKSRHIAPKQVKRSDLAPNAVNSSRVANGSLRAGDFGAGQLPRGATGPGGPTGPAGPTGPTGPTGQAGATGSVASPSSLFRRAHFVHQAVPATGNPAVEIAAVAFTPAATGTALVSIAGWCTVNSDAADNVVQIAAGTSAGDALNLSNLHQVGVVRNNAGNAVAQEAFATTREIDVTEGVLQEVGVFVQHEAGTASATCTGSLVVEAIF